MWLGKLYDTLLGLIQLLQIIVPLSYLQELPTELATGAQAKTMSWT